MWPRVGQGARGGVPWGCALGGVPWGSDLAPPYMAQGKDLAPPDRLRCKSYAVMRIEAWQGQERVARWRVLPGAGVPWGCPGGVPWGCALGAMT